MKQVQINDPELMNPSETEDCKVCGPVYKGHVHGPVYVEVEDDALEDCRHGFIRATCTKCLVDGIVARAKDEINSDIVDLRVPSDVASFSELHEYVDANEYGMYIGAGPFSHVSEFFNLDWIAGANAAQNIVDEWLKAGRPNC